MWTREEDGLKRQHAYWRDLVRLAKNIPAGTRLSFAAFLRRQRRLAPRERARLLAFRRRVQRRPGHPA